MTVAEKQALLDALQALSSSTLTTAALDIGVTRGAKTDAQLRTAAADYASDHN